MIKSRKYLEDRFADVGIMLTNEQIEQFYSYYEYLVEKNKVMNLTAITQYEEVVIKHFIDSLSIIKAVNPMEIDRLIDVGTGAGFPGIPIKIVYPHIKLCLLDSLQKRVLFLEEVCSLLNFNDFDCIHGRAEDYARDPEYRESFDICVSRAVADLSILSEYCIPYVKCDGFFISYKSGKSEDEIRASEKAVFSLGGSIEECNLFSLPHTDITRMLVKVKKIKNTPAKYPRKAGAIKKNPIK